jgi:hypothetical protein
VLPTWNLVKDKNGDLLADSHNALNRWKNQFCQLLNVHGVNNVRQTEIHTAEPLAPERSSCEAEVLCHVTTLYLRHSTTEIKKVFFLRFGCIGIPIKRIKTKIPESLKV